MYVEKHSADGRTCIRRNGNSDWEVWCDDVWQGTFLTRKEARIFIRKLKLPQRTRWSLIVDDTFLAHLPDPV